MIDIVLFVYTVLMGAAAGWFWGENIKLRKKIDAVIDHLGHKLAVAEIKLEQAQKNDYRDARGRFAKRPEGK